jgi:hypothetical protein
LFAVVTFQVIAQTNIVKPQFKTILVTNWIKPGPYLRVVDGVTYNVVYSKKWKKFSDWESLGASVPDMDDPMQTSHLVHGNHRVFTNVAFIQIEREHFKLQDYTGLPYKTFSEPERVVAVLNCEHPETADFYCMQTTNYISKSTGDAYRAYTCGVQATNPVPYMQAVKVKVESTNIEEAIITSPTEEKNK